MVLFLAHFLAKAQRDYVSATFDSLSTIFYYDKINIHQDTNKYNYPENFVPKFSESEYQQRFNTLDRNSPFKFIYKDLVKKYIDNYLHAPKSVAVILANSHYYFPLYENYLIKYQLPLELKYLSVIESALNPTAKSYCGAAGLWQFMPATGKAYGLNITSYVDERYDLEKSTDAACRYLKDLYSIYGDWSLAIAAYNCGAGNINKAIKWSGGKKDFFSIMKYLPTETQGYVPAFMAATYILNFWQIHNIPSVDTKIYFSDMDNIMIEREISIYKLAGLLNINPKELYYFNPSYYVGIIPGNDDKISVPKEQALAFIDYLKGSRKGEILKPPINKGKQGVHKIDTNKTALGLKTFSKKSPFGTVRNVESSKAELIQGAPNNSNENAKQVVNATVNTVYLCEVLTDFNIKSNALCKVRTLCALSDKIPKNSILEGKLIYKGSKSYLYFYRDIKTNERINLDCDFSGNLLEGETIYLTNN